MRGGASVGKAFARPAAMDPRLHCLLIPCLSLFTGTVLYIFQTTSYLGVYHNICDPSLSPSSVLRLAICMKYLGIVTHAYKVPTRKPDLGGL